MQKLRNKREACMRCFLSDEQGVAFVEFAIFAPIFIVLALTTIDLGFYAWSALEVNAALEAGVLFTNTYVSKNGWNWRDPVTGITSNSANDISAVIQQALTGSPGAQTISATPAPTCVWGCVSSSGLSVSSSPCTGSAGTNYCTSAGQALGQFVTISVSMPVRFNYVSPLSANILPATVSGTAFTRVQ